MVQIAICDDDINELSNMLYLVAEYRAAKNISCEYAVFHNGFELMSALEKGRQFDIYCLDIIMPAFSGIEVAKEIRRLDKTAKIIFFTSSCEFALESYSVKAVNYVLKPVTKEKLFFTLDDVLDQMQVSKENHIIVKSCDGVQMILLSSLVYVEVVGRYVSYHLFSGKTIKCMTLFTEVSEQLLQYSSFMKPHRSFIVNMEYIDTIHHAEILMQTDALIPIAQGKHKDVKECYLAFQMGER